MAKSYNDIEIIEDEVGGYAQKNSFRSLLMEHYKKCCTEGGKEKTSGGIISRMVNGQKFEVMVPNQIEIFINHVDMLKIMLYPKIIDQGGYIAKQINDFEKDLIKLKQHNKEKIAELDKTYNKLTEIPGPDGITEKQKYTEEYIGKKNQYNIVLQNQKYDLYKDLFGYLSILLNKLNYFEEAEI